MKYLAWVLISIIVLIPSTVLAADFSPVGQQILFSFDESFPFPCGGISPALPTPLYIVLLNPAHSELFGWEASYEVVGEAIVLTTELAGVATNSGGQREFRVEYSSPLPCTEMTVLATISVMSLESSPSCFVLGGLNGASILGDLPVLKWANGELQQAIAGGIDEGGAAQLLNCPATPEQHYFCVGTVAQKKLNWGTIKSLYR